MHFIDAGQKLVEEEAPALSHEDHVAEVCHHWGQVYVALLGHANPRTDRLVVHHAVDILAGELAMH